MAVVSLVLVASSKANLPDRNHRLLFAQNTLRYPKEAYVEKCLHKFASNLSLRKSDGRLSRTESVTPCCARRRNSYKLCCRDFMIKVIALDLEGTLITNAMSQIPRPGLKGFLELCYSITPRVVMFTTVKESKFRALAKGLVDEGYAPDWFSSMEYINWEGKTKNLSFIPNCDFKSTVLVDDFHIYIEPGQEENWIEIKQFEHPYPKQDNELALIGKIIEGKHNK